MIGYKGDQCMNVRIQPYMMTVTPLSSCGQLPSEKQSTTMVSRRNRRVILFPWSFQGHINPMLQLAIILYSKGFSITILHTNYNAPKTSNYPHFTFRSILDNDPETQRLVSSQGIHGFAANFIFKQDSLGDALRQELEVLIASGKEDKEPVSCLITDVLWHFTQSVADSLELPRLILWYSSLFAMVVYDSISLLDDRGFFKLDNTHLEEQVEEFPFLKLKDMLRVEIRGKSFFDFLMGPALKQAKLSSGIISNSFKELEGPELQMVLNHFPSVPTFLTPFAKHFSAAPSSLLEHDRSFFPWLDQQPPKSVVYVSFGSGSQVSQLEEKDFLEVAHGLVDSKQPFLWVVRPDTPQLINGWKWLESFPDGFLSERGRVVPWAPQEEVLAHKSIGAFWTHSGWNSTLESLNEGVPMICSPFIDDQALTARYITDVAKVGAYLGSYLENGFQRKEIASSITTVLVDHEIRERAKVLKEKLDASVDKGGSSYESLQSLVDYLCSL